MSIVHPARHVALFAAAAAAVADLAGAQQPSLHVAHELVVPGGACVALEFSPDGSLLASGGDCGDVVLVDATTGAVRHVLDASPGPIGSLRFAPDGARLAIAGDEVTLWEVATGALLRRAGERVRCLDWSRDGRWLAVGSGSGAALLRAADLAWVRTLAADCQVLALAFAPDGSQIAVAAGGVQVVDVETGERLERRALHADALAWLDDGRIVRLDRAGSLRGYADRILPLGAPAWSMAAARDGARVAVGTADHGVLVRRDAEAVRVPGRCEAVALHPDGDRWARWTAGAIEVYRGTTHERPVACAHRRMPTDAVLTGDAALAVVAGDALHVFDVASGRAIAVDGLPRPGLLVHERLPGAFAVASGATRRDAVAHDLASWRVERDGTPRARRRHATSEPWIAPPLHRRDVPPGTVLVGRRWSAAAWVSPDVLLGATADGELQLVDARSVATLATLDGRVTARRIDVVPEHGLALVLTADRVLVVQFAAGERPR